MRSVLMLLSLYACQLELTEEAFLDQRVQLLCDSAPGCPDSTVYGMTFDECVAALQPATDAYKEEIATGTVVVCFDPEIAQQCLDDTAAVAEQECTSASELVPESCLDVWQAYIDVNSYAVEPRCEDWRPEN